jgi:hypothetical protein
MPDMLRFPWHSHAAWFLALDASLGWFGAGVDLRLSAERIYRPDPLAGAVVAEGFPWPRCGRQAGGRLLWSAGFRSNRSHDQPKTES